MLQGGIRTLNDIVAVRRKSYTLQVVMFISDECPSLNSSESEGWRELFRKIKRTHHPDEPKKELVRPMLAPDLVETDQA